MFTGETNGIPGEFQGQKGKFILYFTPEDASGNFIRAPQMGNSIFPTTCVSNGVANESSNTSLSGVTSVSTANVGFKELSLKKIGSVKETSASNNRQKRRKVNSYGSIVTRLEKFDELLPRKKISSCC